MFKRLPNFKGEDPVGSRFSLFSAEEYPIRLPALFDTEDVSYNIKRQLIRTGLEPAIPEGYGVIIQGVPGLCHTRGITLVSPFVLTSESFGELKVVLSNLGDISYIVYPKDRIAEAIIIKLGG